MNDPFEKKVRAAAAAGWWVVLIACLFLVVQWIAYLTIVPARPAWLLTMWGPNADWLFIQSVWFWVVAAFKIFIWVMVVIVLWLTLWARQLRKTEHP